MSVGWDALHWTSRTVATMRERRRAERAGLDEEGLDQYATDVYEERRSRRAEFVRFRRADAEAVLVAIEQFDRITPTGRASRHEWVREMIERADSAVAS